MAENGNEFTYTEPTVQDNFDGLGTEDPTAGGDTVNGTASTDDAGVEDPELEAIKARVREMEEEAEKLKEMQSEVDKQMNLSASSVTSPTRFPTIEEKMEADGRSIYVGNVDYGATAEELEQHFNGCGAINRVTILCDKYTGHPKGFAYVEFGDKESVQTAAALDDSLFRGRQIKVVPKRTNKPGISSTDRGRPRGRGRGRGAAAAAAAAAAQVAAFGYPTAYSPYAAYLTGYAPRARGRGAYRGRRIYYSPY